MYYDEYSFDLRLAGRPRYIRRFALIILFSSSFFRFLDVFSVSVDVKHHVYLLTYIFFLCVCEPVWPSGKALGW